MTAAFAEKKDFDAILKFVRERALPNPWLVGWSFGTELVLKYGPEYAGEFTGAILLSPPLHRVHPAELPEAARRLSEGEPVIPTEFI